MTAKRENPEFGSRRGLMLLVLLALIAWGPSVFFTGFSHDDREAIFENPVVTSALPMRAAFERDYWHHRGDAGHYRPLATVSLRLDYALWKETPSGYHATNVLLHASVVLLLGLWLRRRLPGAIPWFGLALFAVHPVLADSVAWLSGRTSMISALGGVAGGALLARSRNPLACAVIAACGLLFALLGKEDGIVFAFAYLICAKERRGAILAGCAAALAAYLALRANALGAALPSAPGAPLADTELLERLRIGGFGILEGSRLAVFPFVYPPHYRVQDLAPEASIESAFAAGFGWFALAILLVEALRARDAFRWSGALLVAAWLPVLQIIPAGEVFAPRFLYPLLLFGAPFVHGLAVRSVRAPKQQKFLFALVIAAALPAAWSRTRVYESRGSYRLAVLDQHPDDARSWNGLGHHFFERKDLERAREAWLRATTLEPRYSRPWTNLGISHQNAGEAKLALPYLEEAIRVGPRNAIAHIWLGRTRLSLGEAEEAARLFETATELAPGMAAAWNGLAGARLELRDLSGAREAASRARALSPASSETRAIWARIEAATD